MRSELTVLSAVVLSCAGCFSSAPTENHPLSYRRPASVQVNKTTAAPRKSVAQQPQPAPAIVYERTAATTPKRVESAKLAKPVVKPAATAAAAAAPSPAEVKESRLRRLLELGLIDESEFQKRMNAD